MSFQVTAGYTETFWPGRKFIAEQIMAIGSQLSLFVTGKFLDFGDFKL